jgi:hypothetical protein
MEAIVFRLTLVTLSMTMTVQAQTSTNDQLAKQFMPPAFTAFKAANQGLGDRRRGSVLPIVLSSRTG